MKDQQSLTGEKRRFNEDELVFMLSEELKKPLTVIKSLAEVSSDGTLINLEVRKALRTIDNVLLYQRLLAEQTTLKLEPVHLGNTLTKIINELQPLSIKHGCEVEMFIQSGIATIDTDATVLQSGIESLWQAVLSMTQRPSALNWHIYRSHPGIRVAITNNSIDLSKVSLTTAKDTAGRSRQPFRGIASPATDLLTACGLFGLLGSRIAKIHKSGQSGLAATFPISAQLALV